MTTTTDNTEKEAEARDKQALEKHRGERTSGGQIQRLQIKSFGELENLAVILGKSDIVPKDMIGKPANILLALMFGNELGLSPAQALQNIMVVNGRPCLWGDATMGLVMASNVYEDSIDSYDPATKTATFKAKRKGKEWVTRTFSMADAAVAKLSTKEGPWQTYPTRMLFHRARSWALRDTFPDVLKGIRYYEEERDIIETTAERGGKDYSIPKEKDASAPAAAAPKAEEPSKQAPIETTASYNKEEGREEVFRVSGGATSTEFDGECFVVRDDAETPNKYFHANADWHSIAKAAKDAKGYVTVRWVEKQSKKGVVRWLVALSLKS